MADQARQAPVQISGGQKQRVAVARALATNAQLVLADEPTANLDHDTAYRIIELMKKMRDDFGTTFVFSTHDPKIMAEAEVVFALEDGQSPPRGPGISGGHSMLNVLKMALRNLARFGRRTLLSVDAHHPGHRRGAAVHRHGRFVQGDDDRPVHRWRTRAPGGAPQGLRRVDRHAAAEPEHAAGAGGQGRAGAREAGRRGSLFGTRQARRHVQQFHRDHQHPHQWHRPGEGGRGDPLLPGRIIEGARKAAGGQAGASPDSGAAGPGHEGQGRRCRRACRDESRRIGQRQDLRRPGHRRQHDGSERSRRLHPYQRRPRTAAAEGARGQRDRHSPEESRAARPSLRQAEPRTGRRDEQGGEAGIGCAHVGRPVTVFEYRAHDRPAGACSSRSCLSPSC